MASAFTMDEGSQLRRSHNPEGLLSSGARSAPDDNRRKKRRERRRRERAEVRRGGHHTEDQTLSERGSASMYAHDPLYPLFPAWMIQILLPLACQDETSVRFSG